MAFEVLLSFAVQLACLSLAGAGAASMLRWARIPGGAPAAAIVGGLIAGLLIGPGVAGRVAPTLHERVLVGGARERLAIESLQGRHAAERTALSATGVTPAALEDLVEQQHEELRAVRETHESAIERHRALADWGVIVLLSIALAMAAWSARRFARPHATWASDSGVVAAAFLAVAVAGVTTAVVMGWMFDAPAKQGLAVGGAVAAGSAFAGLPMRWIPAMGRIRAVRGFGVLGMVIAAGFVALAVRDEKLAWLIVPAMAFGVGTIAAAAKQASGRSRRRVFNCAMFLVLPTAAAYATYRLDLSLLTGWQPVLLVVFAALTAGDGHFIGAWLGIQIFAPDDQRMVSHALCVEFATSGVGLTQVCFAVVLIAADVISPETRLGAAALALILSNAAMIELTSGLSRWGARRLIGG